MNNADMKFGNSDYINRGYRFSVGFDVEIGIKTVISAKMQTTAGIKGRRMYTNVPTHSLIYIDCLIFANINIILGDVIDAYDISMHNPRAVLDVYLPELTMDNYVKLHGQYNGRTWPGFQHLDIFKLLLTIEGNTMLAGDQTAGVVDK
jgi:hypothetical protein